MFRENWEEAFPADTSNTNASKSSDDILTLLRKYQPYSKLHGQAADEIERLRAEVARLGSFSDTLIRMNLGGFND